jgi:alpha-glucosidase
MMTDELPWWQTGVIYQIYPRSFNDSSADGIGDLQGIIGQLDYLNWLGVDAIWICPFYPSPMADFGYDVSDYCNVDPRFGTLQTFDTLVEQALKHKIRVIIDFVPNHTSHQHPWFLQSRMSRSDPKRDWYVWADPKPDGSPPNNWLSMLGGSSGGAARAWKRGEGQRPSPLRPADSSWEWDSATSQYYLHSFLKQQPDLNWRNPDVVAAMFEVLRFWMARGVDGFRIDVANFLMKDPQLRDNPPNPERLIIYKARGDYDAQLHIHDWGHPDIHEVLRQLRHVLDGDSLSTARMALGELAVFTPQEWASYYGGQLDEIHLPFNFGFFGALWRAQAIRQIVETSEAVMPAGAWPDYVLGNHDELRIASRIGRRQARVAMTLLLTLRGTPVMYYGDELGMCDIVIAPERIQDPQEKNVPGLGLGRDPARTPMQWDTSPNAGFCPPGVEPWLPVAADYEQINVASQREEKASMLTLTRRLLALRRRMPALNRGSYQGLEGGAEECFVYLRTSGTQRLLVALNFSEQPQVVQLAELGKGEICVSTSFYRAGEVDLSALCLDGHEGCVIELRS